MPKDTFYFSHDYHARNDEKILELRVKYGVEGYGLFWMVVETMAENENGGAKASLMGGLSLGYGVAKAMLFEFINFCIEIGLFYEKDGFYFSKRMLKHKSIRSSLSESGKIGAEKRWGGHSTPNAKERKGNNKNTNSIIVKNSENGKNQPVNFKAQGENLYFERSKRRSSETNQDTKEDIGS